MTVTKLFDFLSKNNSFSVDRREIFSVQFSTLRYNLRYIIKSLNEFDTNSQDISQNLRRILSEWLTVPVHFDNEMVNSIFMGDLPSVTRQWGRDIAYAYQNANDAVNILIQNENPLRSELRKVISDLKTNNSSFKIFCHRLARPCFESIMTDSLGITNSESLFLHSVKNYRESPIFEFLLKVGPFRSKGWGSIPDAVLTAPRFKILINLIWSGCKDELGFGLDPVTGSTIIEQASSDLSKPSEDKAKPIINWVSVTKKIGDSLLENKLLVNDEDEFQMFQVMDKTRQMRSATLVQVDVDYGILVPSHSKVFSFDPSVIANEQVGRRLPEETLNEGMYIVSFEQTSTDIGIGSIQVKDGRFSPIWKERLKGEFYKDQNGFCERLFRAGIKLTWLNSRVKEWCKMLTTVIPAPQKMEHFKTLIDTLNLNSQQVSSSGIQIQWWQYAWAEIRQSRGEAISEGLFEQGIKDDKIEEILKKLQPQILEKSKNENHLTVEISKGNEFQGRFILSKIVSIESGFHAPEAVLWQINEIRDFITWRD
jgi:hypothetical protein